MAREKIENGAYYEHIGKSAQNTLKKTAIDDVLANSLWQWIEGALKGFSVESELDSQDRDSVKV